MASTKFWVVETKVGGLPWRDAVFPNQRVPLHTSKGAAELYIEVLRTWDDPTWSTAEYQAVKASPAQVARGQIHLSPKEVLQATWKLLDEAQKVLPEVLNVSCQTVSPKEHRQASEAFRLVEQAKRVVSGLRP